MTALISEAGGLGAMQNPASAGAIAPQGRDVANTDQRCNVPRLVLSGVAASSPLMCLLAARLAGSAELGTAGDVVAARGRWRRSVTDTGLQWFDEGDRTAGALGDGTGDLVVNLHGVGAATARRIWRVVGSAGDGVLAPFFGLDECWAPEGSVPLYLIESTDGGGRWTLLEEVRLSALQSHRVLLEGVAHAVAHLLATGVERHARPVSEPRGPTWRPHGRRRPPPLARLNYHAAGAARRLREYATCELWAIGLADATPEDFLAGEPVQVSRWIEIPQADGYIADPMPWPGRTDLILCEQFSHGSGRGSLRALTIADHGIVANEEVALPVGCHLSYPFAWAEMGRVLCLPEMGACRRQVIYELHQGASPTPVCVVAENVSMADPTLFRSDGLYWIAYTDGDIGLYDNLCLLWAEHLEGPWHPHRANPVKFDVRSSRGAGALFQSGGRLIRPAQDCSRTYGGAVVLNRVVDCTTMAYREERVASVLPDPAGRFPDGLHTFSVCGNAVLIDGKRYAVDFGVLRQRVRSRLRRYVHRVSRRGRDGRSAPDMLADLSSPARVTAASGQLTGSLS